MSDVAMSFPLSTTAPGAGRPSAGPSVASSSVATIVIGLALRMVAALHSSALFVCDVVVTRVERIIERSRDDRGQATTEYALVLLAAALVALLLVAWATAGGGAAKISRLFNRVIDAVIDRV